LIGGMLQNSFNAGQILASDTSAEQLERLHCQFGIHTTTDNAELARDCDVLVLSVKPQVMQAVCAALPAPRRSGQPVVSIAAGLTRLCFAACLIAKTTLILCMPNTPAMRGQSVSRLFAMPRVSDQQRYLTESILTAVGLSLWLKQESKNNDVYAVSG